MELSRYKSKSEALKVVSDSNDIFALAAAPKDGKFPSLQLARYCVLAAVLLGVLVCIKLFAPMWPTWGIALVWALLTSFASIGIAYSWVMRKTHRQVKYQPGGKMEWLNRGRVLCIIVSYLLGAALTMSLISEVPKWNELDWTLAVLAAPIFCVVALCVRRRVRKEFKPPFQTAGIVSWASVLTTGVLCLIFAIALLAFPEPTSGSALESFLNTENPYETSPSVLMSQIGALSAFFEGLTKYAISEAALLDKLIAVGWNLVLSASGFFAIAKILSICSMSQAEMKRVFQRLEDLTIDENQSSKPVHKGYITTAVLVTIAIFGGFCGAEYLADEVSKQSFVKSTTNIIQEQVAKSVCIINGKYYDRQKVDTLIQEESKKADELSKRANKELAPLIDDSFDGRLANVDSYISWFYGPGGIGEGAKSLISQKSSSVFKEKLDDTIEKGIDDTELYTQIAGFSAEAKGIQAGVLEKIEPLELHPEQEWLTTMADPLSDYELNAATRSVAGLLDPSKTLGHDESTNIRISINYPKWTDTPMPDDYKKGIEAAIDEERDNYLKLIQ